MSRQYRVEVNGAKVRDFKKQVDAIFALGVAMALHAGDCGGRVVRFDSDDPMWRGTVFSAGDIAPELAPT